MGVALVVLDLGLAVEYIPLAGNDLGLHLVDLLSGALSDQILAQGSQGHQAVGHVAEVVVNLLAGNPGAVDHVLHGLGVVNAPVPHYAGQGGSGSILAHIAVVANAPDTVLLSSQLGTGGVAVLTDHVAAGSDQSLGGLLLAFGIEPAVGHLHVNLSIRVHAGNAHSEGVDAAGNLAVVLAHGGHVADLVGLGLQAGGDAAQVTGLVDAAEVVVEVGAVGLVTGAVAEDDLGIFLGHGLTGVHVAPGGGEDDVAAFLHQLGQSVLHSGSVGIGHVDLLHQLVLRQADVLHHALDALLVGVAVAGALSGVGQVHNAHLDVFLGNAGAGGLGGSGSAAGGGGGSSAAGSGAAAAGGQAYGHHSGQRKAQNLFHVKSPPYKVVESFHSRKRREQAAGPPAPASSFL